MSFELALRLSEALLGWAIFLQSLEHLAGTKSERWIFAPRLVASVLLIFGIWPAWVLPALWGLGVVSLHRFQGPYNGGSDKMTFLILTCLTAAHLLPERHWQELAFGYLAVQLVLSYVVSGWIKVINPSWRSGQALADVFEFSAYPVSENLRGWSNHRGVMIMASAGVIGFELIFPLGLLHPIALLACLLIAMGFHLANACLFGLTRFFWIWISAYPALIWFQWRLFA